MKQMNYSPQGQSCHIEAGRQKQIGRDLPREETK
jgi:hypothetical protein